MEGLASEYQHLSRPIEELIKNQGCEAKSDESPRASVAGSGYTNCPTSEPCIATCDVLIIGSGYGGSIAADVLAGTSDPNTGKPIRVMVLEGCPHVCDDNPYSEAQFKTLKYRPDFPDRFGCIEDARAHCQAFFTWYNTAHRHSGIGLMTPQTVHYGRARELTRQRSITLDAAFRAHPNRFKGFAPLPSELPVAAWINPPKKKVSDPATKIDACSLN